MHGARTADSDESHVLPVSQSGERARPCRRSLRSHSELELDHRWCPMTSLEHQVEYISSRHFHALFRILPPHPQISLSVTSHTLSSWITASNAVSISTGRAPKHDSSHTGKGGNGRPLPSLGFFHPCFHHLSSAVSSHRYILCYTRQQSAGYIPDAKIVPIESVVATKTLRNKSIASVSTWAFIITPLYAVNKELHLKNCTN